MATRVNNGNINWNNNWQTVGQEKTLHASTNLNVTSAAPRYSAYWVGDAAKTNLGVLAYLTAIATTYPTITVALESADDTAFTVNLATETSTTLAITSATKTLTWFFFKYAATITENAAKYYRIKFSSDQTSNNSFRSDNADTTKVAIIQVLNATAALAAGDVTYIVGTTQASTGNPTAQTVTMNENSITEYGILNIENGGTLNWSNVATTKLTIAGQYIYVRNGGTLSIGTVASPIPSSYIAELVYNPPANGEFEIAGGGQLILQGASKSFIATRPASVIAVNDTTFTTVDTTGWAVGDEIVVTTTSNIRTQTEKVTIASITGTSIGVSGGGGAGGGFAYAHDASAYVLNITRNVIISSNGIYNSYIQPYTSTIDADWCSLKSLKGAYAIDTLYNQGDIYLCSFNRMVIRDTVGGGINNNNGDGKSGVHTNTNNIFYNNSANNVLYLINLATIDTAMSDINNLYMVNNSVGGLFTSKTSFGGNISFSNIYSIANNGYGLYVDPRHKKAVLTNYYSQCNNGSSLVLYGMVDVVNHIAGYNARGLQANGACAIREYDSIYSKDDKGNSKANTGNDIAKGDGNYAAFIGDYYGMNIDTVVSKVNWFWAGDIIRLNTYNEAKITNLGKVSTRHFTNKYWGNISDQITNGQTAAYAKGGSGICVALNPISQTIPLNWEFYIPVTAATATTLKFYITKTTAGFNGSVKVTIFDSHDDNTKLLNQETIPNASIPLNDGVGDDWTYQYSATPVTPTNTGFCRVLVEALDGATTGDILVDSISNT